MSGTPALADPRAQFSPGITVYGHTLPLRGASRLVWVRMVTVNDKEVHYLP